MKIVPNPAAFTALSDTDFKRAPRPQGRDVDVARASKEASARQKEVHEAKVTAKVQQTKTDRKTSDVRADQEARIDRHLQEVRAERRSREAPRPRSSGQRLGQHVDIRV